MRYKTATNWNFYQFAGFSQLSKRGAKALFEKLRTFYNNRDFVLRIMCNAPHEDDMKTILKYIEKGKDVTRESLILLSLELGNKRDIEK